MSSMGLVYNASAASSSSAGAGAAEQLMLLRALQDNQTNISPKNSVSVISLNANCKSNGQALPAYDPSRLKKHGKKGQPPPIAVAKRNARERNRVKQVNNGFATLRQHIPSHVAQGYGDRGKKLSKVETLRMAVEYIRGLQRLLAEADGTDLETKLGNANNDSSMMIPSPTGSLYSSSTHNGSAEVFGLDDHQQQLIDEEDDDDDQQQQQHHHYNDDELQVNELQHRKPIKRAASRLSENQKRERCRRREDSYYKPASFGDEENIEPLGNRNNINNNNNSNVNNNNNVLGSFTPILVQTTTTASNNLGCVKREVPLLDEDESRRSSDEEPGNGGVILASSSPYTGEIFIENPETGRLVPLKIEEHEAQLVYVSTEPAYYKTELADGTGELSWWEQECIVQQMQQQQPAPPGQRPLAHV